jgi:hypothetical protein
VLLKLGSITCRKTQGETVEEPFLRIYIDGSDYPLGFWGYTRGRSMRRGESAVINLGYEFDSDARVELWECDDPRFGTALDYPNQHIGDILVSPRLRGRYTEVLGPSLGAPTSRAYTLTFDVLENHEDTLDDYCLTLRTLRCDDAQEAEDEVYLKVDDRTVWGPESIRTDQAESITLRPVPIKNTAMIELWEKDSSRSDFLGQFRLEITDGFDFAGIQERRFSRDDGIAGDATYTLFYSVRPRDWVAGGC